MRWLLNSKRLSRDQLSALERAARRSEQVALSAITLLEIAALKSAGKLDMPLDRFFEELQAN